jgi:hypothetical protein
MVNNVCCVSKRVHVSLRLVLVRSAKGCCHCMYILDSICVLCKSMASTWDIQQCTLPQLSQYSRRKRLLVQFVTHNRQEILSPKSTTTYLCQSNKKLSLHVNRSEHVPFFNLKNGLPQLHICNLLKIFCSKTARHKHAIFFLTAHNVLENCCSATAYLHLCN